MILDKKLKNAGLTAVGAVLLMFGVTQCNSKKKAYELLGQANKLIYKYDSLMNVTATKTAEITSLCKILEVENRKLWDEVYKLEENNFMLCDSIDSLRGFRDSVMQNTKVKSK